MKSRNELVARGEGREKSAAMNDTGYCSNLQLALSEGYRYMRTLYMLFPATAAQVVLKIGRVFLLFVTWAAYLLKGSPHFTFYVKCRQFLGCHYTYELSGLSARSGNSSDEIFKRPCHVT